MGDYVSDILRMSRKYNFYPREIEMDCLASLGFAYKYTNKYGGDVDIDICPICDGGEMIGFYITHSYKGCPNGGDKVGDKDITLGKFYFLKPEYRRRGYFTKHISLLKDKSDEIWIDTDKKPMIHALDKLGFKFVRVCDSGKELCYSWKK